MSQARRNWSRKNQKGFIFSDSAYDYDAPDPEKTRSESQAEAERFANHIASSQPFPVQSSACDSDTSVFIAS